MTEDVKYIRENTTESDLLDLLEEECAELSHAVAKLKRAKGYNSNWTPVSVEQAEADVKEEANDVLLVLYIMGDKRLSFEDKNWKAGRWANRIKYSKVCDDISSGGIK